MAMVTVTEWLGRPKRVSRRAIVLVAVSAAAAALIAYLVVEVPVAAPAPGGHLLLFCPLAPLPLPRGQISRHWPVALTGALVVLTVDALAVWIALRRRRAPLRPRPAPAPAESPLRLERVPLRAVGIAAAASLTLLVAGLSQGYAMWIPVGFALLPWIPLVTLEASWKYNHYGFWAIFGVAVLLQIGHMGEHTVQVTQLLLYNGQLAQSHGVFGQLDFETIHFIWDSAVWVLLCVVLMRFGRGNRWLWVAFAAASLHEVEHLYLFWIYTADPWFYAHGGLEGIMGNGGLIGSPLARPYLHFAYNFMVVVPMVCAFLDQTRLVYDRRQAALPTALERPATAGSPPRTPIGMAPSAIQR
ncbi:MAG: hypothetical protein JOZ98_01255 [Solirubrobacterales bacterium]|nr:hypothetical protein [Solirubrobacterales bacterium]